MKDVGWFNFLEEGKRAATVEQIGIFGASKNPLFIWLWVLLSYPLHGPAN